MISVSPHEGAGSMRAKLMPSFFICLSVAASGEALPSNWGQAQSLTIELSNFKFNPPTVTLERGTPYKLHFVNDAGGGHDFAAKQFFAASEVAPDDAAKVNGGSIKLDGHESADVKLIPMQAGTFKVRCTHFMHSAFGMTGTVIVR
jgi:plastocyanin